MRRVAIALANAEDSCIRQRNSGGRKAVRTFDDRIECTRRTYDRIANRFLNHSRGSSTVRDWLRRFAGELRPGDAVLDLGSGPGFDSAEFRRRGLRAVSLDLSLAILNASAKQLAGSRAQADARQLPFRTSSFAAVWANASLVHFTADEAAVALSEARRILKISGLMHVSVKSGSGSEWESERFGEPRWFQYWSSSELDGLLHEAGFRIVASWPSSAGWLARLAAPDPRRRTPS